MIKILFILVVLLIIYVYLLRESLEVIGKAIGELNEKFKRLIESNEQTIEEIRKEKELLSSDKIESLKRELKEAKKDIK